MAVQEFEDAVIIDGSQDVVQLEVQGHSTQTEPLQEWQDSSGTVLAEVTENGHFHTGDLTMGTPAALIEANESISMPSSGVKQGLQSRGEFDGQVTDPQAWGVQELEFMGSGGVSSVQSAMRGKVTHGNSGDSSAAELRAGDFEAVNETGSSGDPVGQATGLHAAASNESGAYLAKAVGIEATINNENTGDIANAAAFEVATPINDGVIDSLVGLKVNDINQGTANYAIQTGEGIAQFGDVVELAEQSSAPATPTSGIVRIYPKTDKKLYAKNSAGTEFELGGNGILNNFSATSAPTVDDDSGDGYIIGSTWIDTTTGKVYRCVDASSGAAVWVETSANDPNVSYVAASGSTTSTTPVQLTGAQVSLTKRYDNSIIRCVWTAYSRNTVIVNQCRFQFYDGEYKIMCVNG